MADRILPGHPLPLAAALPDHRMRDPVRGMHKIECVPAFYAQMPAAYRCIHRRPHGNQAVVRDTRLHLAARATVGTGGPRPRRRWGTVEHVLVLQSARGAGIHACATGDATAFPKLDVLVRDNAGCAASIPDVPYKLALELGANPHATIAVDAPRHLNLNVRVRIVDCPALR